MPVALPATLPLSKRQKLALVCMAVGPEVAARLTTSFSAEETETLSLEIAQVIREHAERVGTTAVHFAIGWVLNNRLVTGSILGPRTEAHLEDYLAALDYRFTAEDEALVDRLVPPGHPSTPGYNDPQYPIEGRVPVAG